jgi:O-antigen/teichoic acid export membrane protein
MCDSPLGSGNNFLNDKHRRGADAPAALNTIQESNLSKETMTNDLSNEYSGKIPAMAGLVARGGLWGLGGQGITLLTSLIATPFIIRLLGTEYYGLLTLVNVLIGYFAFSDFGVGIASTKHAAEARAHGDDKEESAVVWTSLILIIIPVILVSGFLFASAGFLVESVFKIPTHLAREARLAIQLVPVIIGASAVSGILNTPQLVRLRYDLNAAITMGSSALQTCIVLAAILMGGKIVSVILVMASVSVTTALLHLIVSSNLFPRMRRPGINRKLIRPLLKFGLGIVAMAAIGLVIVYGEKLLLVRLGSVKLLAYYNVAFTLAGLLTLATNATCQPLFPTFVYLWSGNERERLRRLYDGVMRGVLFVSVPGAILICACAKDFLRLWAGPEYGQESTYAAYILAFGCVVYCLSLAPRNLLTAMGEVNLVARYQAAEIVPYFLLAYVLIAKFGVPGAAIAWCLRVIIESFLLSWRVHRITGLPFVPAPENPRRYALSLILLLIPITTMLITGLSSLTSYIAALACFTAYLIVSVKALLCPVERSWIKEHISITVSRIFRYR